MVYGDRGVAVCAGDLFPENLCQFGEFVTGWRLLCANCRYDTVDPSRLRRFVSRKYIPTP